MPHRKKSFIYLTAAVCSMLLAVSGCRDEPAELPEVAGPMSVPLYFEPIGRGQSAQVNDTTQVVIRDSLEWQAFQDRLAPVQPFRPADFTQGMVILAALPVPSSGYAVEFESIEKLGDTITASFVLMRPGPDCMIAPALTTPFQAVLVRRAEGDVRFEHRVEDLPCTFRQ